MTSSKSDIVIRVNKKIVSRLEGISIKEEDRGETNRSYYKGESIESSKGADLEGSEWSQAAA